MQLYVWPGYYNFSSRGKEYVLISFHYDAKGIVGWTVWNKQAATLTKLWKQLRQQLEKWRLAPNTYILKNEALAELQNATAKSNTKF